MPQTSDQFRGADTEGAGGGDGDDGEGLLFSRGGGEEGADGVRGSGYGGVWAVTWGIGREGKGKGKGEEEREEGG